MAKYLFSNVKGTSLRFNPRLDELRFDTGSAADLRLSLTSSTLMVHVGTEWVALDGITGFGALSATNLRFADGSRFRVGDGSASTANDHLANTVEGGSGRDLLMGLGGNDTLLGRGGDDRLVGGEGDDSLDGGRGRDAAVYAGSLASYELLRGADGRVTVRDLDDSDGSEGTDVLYGIEYLEFADGTVVDLTAAPPPPPPPVEEPPPPVEELPPPPPPPPPAPVVTNAAPVAANDSASVAANTPSLAVNVLGNDTDADSGDVLKVVGVQGSTGMLGQLALAGDGSGVVYGLSGDPFKHLGAGITAVETFSYTVRDAAGAEATATVTMTITGVNDGPTAGNDSVAATEGQALFIDILGNDTDPDSGDVLTLQSIDRTNASGQTAFASSGGRSLIYYTPSEALAEGQVAEDSFSYTIRDSSGATATASVIVSVTGKNDAPIAHADSITVSEDAGTIGIDVLGNDTDVDAGDTKTITIVDGSGRPATFTLVIIYGVGAPLPVPAIPAIRGEVSIAEGGQSLLYTPGEGLKHLGQGQSVVETIFYSMIDREGAMSSSQLQVTVQGANDGPTAVDDAIEVAKNAGAIAINVLANDSDPDSGDLISIDTFDSTSARGGTVSIGANGAINYSVGNAFEGLQPGDVDTDTFSYTIRDRFGATSTATVTITITGTNSAPVANADTAAAVENGAPVTIDVLSNDADPDAGDARTVIGVHTTAATQGQVSIAPGGTGVVYAVGSAFQSLGAGATAEDSFSYTIQDRNGAQATAEVTVTITGINDAPVARADTLSNVHEGDGALAINVLANDTDIDAGDSLSLVTVNRPAGLRGTVEQNADHTISYTPNHQALRGGQTAVDTFTYQVADGKGGVATGTVSITVIGENDGPNAVADAATVSEDASATTIAVLGNDTDVDVGDSKRVVSVSNTDSVTGNALRGTVAVAANGTGLVYNPGSAFQSLSTGQSATEQFTYTMIDGGGATSEATVTVTINGATDAARAAADSYSFGENAGPQSLYLLANDSNGDLNPAGQMHITGIDGAGQFSFLELIIIYGVGVGRFHEGTPRMLGEATIGEGGKSVIYTPFQSLNEGEVGTDVFRYTLTGSDGVVSTNTVTITVTGANDAPTAVDDAADASADGAPVTIDVLANDTDPDTRVDPPQPAFDEFSWDPTPADVPDTKAVVSVVTPTGFQGVVEVAEDNGSVIYRAGGTLLDLGYGESATESFTYTMRDAGGLESTATVTVTVTGTNAAPVAVADAAAATENDSAVTINVLNNDTDADSASGDSLSIVALATSGLRGSAAVVGGSVVYTIGNAFQALGEGDETTDTFAYTIADSNDAQASATVTVTITGVNDAPVAVADARSVSEDSAPVTLDVLGNDTDADATDTKNIESFDDLGGRVQAGPNGSLIYTVNPAHQALLAGQTATETFSYTMADRFGVTSIATVTITIVGANEPVVYINPPAPQADNTVGTAGDDIMTGTDGNDVMYGQAGDDEMSGEGGNDTLFGGAEDDTLDGGEGNDILSGGAGRDSLTGGAGADNFRFYLAAESRGLDIDRIDDFTRAEGDKIDLGLIDANTVLGGNDAFTLVAAFTGRAGELMYSETVSGLLVQGDVNGDGLADLAIEVRLVGTTELRATDFVL